MGNNARGNHFFALLFVVDSTDATSRLFKHEPRSLGRGSGGSTLSGGLTALSKT